jgi:GntR family transcriptional regulator
MITIDKLSPIPVYKQIVLQVKKEIILGRLKKGDKLPPIRDLSKSLKVNVNTVLKAYERLVSEGIAFSEHGKGFFIREEMSVPKDLVENLREVAKKMKDHGVELGLAMMIIQEVWSDERI